MSSTIMQTTANPISDRIATRKLLWAGPAAGAIAAIANVVVFLISTGPFNMPLIMPSFGSMEILAPLPIFPVIASSIMGGVGAAVVLAIVARFSHKPSFVFQIVAAVAFIFSLGMLLALPSGVETSTKITLGIMHTVGWATIAATLPRLAREN